MVGLQHLRAAVRNLAGWVRAGGAVGLARPGLYAYDTHPADATRRIHLRVHADGSGLLLVDATHVVHLNPTGVIVAKLALDGVPMQQCARQLLARFRDGQPEQVRQDVGRVYSLVEHLARTTEACPTCQLSGVERVGLFSVPIHAPLRADLALTYACNNACAHCYNPAGRAALGSLSLRQWRRVLDRLAAVGVPQVIFTGGEPTLVPELAALVAHATRQGLVTGLNTNGRRLSDRGLVERLVSSGLAHVQITVESCQPEVHDAMTGAASFAETLCGLRHALEAGLHTITNTTLTRFNAPHALETLRFLDRLGLRTVAFNGMIYAGRGRESPAAIPESELGPILVSLRDEAASLGMRLVWYTPMAWCRTSPMELELGARRCGAAEYAIGVEPNGDVLPCQSYYEPVGNLLRDPWEAIWESPLFRRLRERTVRPSALGLAAQCGSCPDLPLCGGGCPLERQAHNPAGSVAVSPGPGLPRLERRACMADLVGVHEP